jgi:hypothetical protein
LRIAAERPIKRTILGKAFSLHIIAIANQKVGSARTTTAAAEAALNRLEGLRLGCWAVDPSGCKGGRPPRRFRLYTDASADKTSGNARNTEFCQEEDSVEAKKQANDPEEGNRILDEAAANEVMEWTG